MSSLFSALKFQCLNFVELQCSLEGVDFGVIGEGEITICELCYALEYGRNISDIKGIIYKTKDGYKITEPREEIESIDDIPWPDYEGFDFDKYLASSPSISGLNVKNTVFMIASRSCPYNCTFCFHTVGRKYRQRSLDSFFSELDYLVSRYHIKFICLADELFSNNMKRMKEFCNRMQAYNIQWWAQFRVDNMNSDMLCLLKKGGCKVMSFGLESADNRILKSMRKHITVEQIEKTLKLVYDAGISMEGAFIFGDIAETWETANNTLNWWKKHSEYKINLNVITVYPGSYLYKYACDNGIIKNKVQFLKDGCPQINVSRLSKGEFAILLRNIIEAPMTLAKTLKDAKITQIEYGNGRICIDGICVICKHRNYWDNIKLFTTNFLGCKECGQRYNTMLTPDLRTNIDNNVKRLLAIHGKLAVWGINYHTADLFKHSNVMRTDGIYPVDISDAKQKMDLYGKKIFSPSIINDKNIEVVVIAIPVYYSQIREQIIANYRHVKRIVDICQLVNPEYNLLDKPSFDSALRQSQS